MMKPLMRARGRCTQPSPPSRPNQAASADGWRLALYRIEIARRAHVQQNCDTTRLSVARRLLWLASRRLLVLTAPDMVVWPGLWVSLCLLCAYQAVWNRIGAANDCRSYHRLLCPEWDWIETSGPCGHQTAKCRDPVETPRARQ